MLCLIGLYEGSEWLGYLAVDSHDNPMIARLAKNGVRLPNDASGADRLKTLSDRLIRRYQFKRKFVYSLVA